MSSFAYIHPAFADDVVPAAPTILPSNDTVNPFDACMALVGEGNSDPAAWAALWMQRLRAFGVPIATNVDAADWTNIILRCVRFHGVEV